MYTEQDAKNALLKVADKYGLPMAKLVERIYRVETNHFKSMQYRLTGSAGMEAGKWGKHIAAGKTKGTVTMNDADKSDGADKFIVWNSVTDAMFFLADYINRHGGNYANWNSTNPTAQKAYAAKVNSVKNRLV